MTEPTICPWCQSEIVWDEEIGPEEHCPHCENELKGYRTISVGLDDEEDEDVVGDELPDPDEDSSDIFQDPAGLNQPFWGGEKTRDPGVEVLEQYGEDYDLMAYEESVEKALDHQEEVPECMHCKEYMLLAGQQVVTGEGFNPVHPPHLQAPLLKPPFQYQVYVCSGCFQVQYTLCDDDRQRLIKGLTESS
ncbi:hypothetical protein [Paenibacillus lemnae]|uniref:Uncharacterized protein n=1 Tax=Paenibacillus lemnae TaxID=1330551 RepID=A0A848M773_PAELE|nr:hypothetical protein [Paenibacillus lemnae]